LVCLLFVIGHSHSVGSQMSDSDSDFDITADLLGPSTSTSTKKPTKTKANLGNPQHSVFGVPEEL